MGSYLSILNNTSDEWMVKIGPDQAAIRIASITGSVLAAVATASVTAGAAAPFVTSLAANGVLSVFGVSTTVLAATTAAAAAASGVALGVSIPTNWATAMVILINSKLSEDFDKLRPGETKQYGKMSLSLWQQGTCIRARVDPANPEQVLVERVCMRPIFSGSTHNSNRTHNIQFWINKFGIEHVSTIILADASSNERSKE